MYCLARHLGIVPVVKPPAIVRRGTISTRKSYKPYTSGNRAFFFSFKEPVYEHTTGRMAPGQESISAHHPSLVLKRCSPRVGRDSGLGETPPLRPPCSQQLPRSAPTRTSQNAICPRALTPGKGHPNYPFLVFVPSLPALLLAKEPATALTGVSFFPSTATFYFLLPSCITAMPMEVKSPSGK